MIDWGAETWGMAGHNVHESSTGSWLEAERATGDYSGSEVSTGGRSWLEAESDG